MRGTESFVYPNDIEPAWGLMIVLYPYITGLVAGAFVVSALYHVLGREELRPVSRMALVTSLSFCSVATVPLLLHLHQPQRCFQVMITPSPTSAIAGFGLIYSAYMLLLVVEVWLVFRPTIVAGAVSRDGLVGRIYRVLALGSREISPGAMAVDARWISWLSIAGIPAACVLHGYVGFLFGAVKANPWWSTALMPVIFLVSAIVSGIALLVVLYLWLNCWRRTRPDGDCLRSLARYLWLFLVLAVSLELLEMGQLAYEASGEWEVLRSLLVERLAVSYWLVQLLIGSIVPLVLLPIAMHPRLPGPLASCIAGLCSLLVLVQVLAMRWNVVIGGQLFSKSFQGFIDFPLRWGGREGLVAAGFVLLLPLVVLRFAGKLFPFVPDATPTREPLDGTT